jgi:hypothetical protein
VADLLAAGAGNMLDQIVAVVVDAQGGVWLPAGGVYLVSPSFKQSGMVRVLDERRGRLNPVKLHPEIVECIRPQAHSSPGTGAPLRPKGVPCPRGRDRDPATSTATQRQHGAGR